MVKNLVIQLFLSIVMSVPAIGQPPRILITTDIGGDPDDKQSLIRLMVYTNEFDIEGFISSAAGVPGELGRDIIYPEEIEKIIYGYGQVFPNLIKHDKNYPAQEKLLSVVKSGNPQRGWNHVGEGKDTEGSEWIIRMADKKDKRQLNICIFGGQTDLAQALWKVKNSRTKREYQKFISGIRVYDIMDQDHIFGKIINEHPALFYILSKAPEEQEGNDGWDGIYRGMFLGGDESLTSLQWLKEHVIEEHGALGALYPTKTWTAPNPHGALKEGDTPSWFFFLKNGLNCAEHPEYGGWGGRYKKNDAGYYSDVTIPGEKNANVTIHRWRDDFQRDFAARMDWCVKDYSSANHAPWVSVNGFSKKEALSIRLKPGKTIWFDASETKDPDGNQLRFEWMLYPEAGNFEGQVQLKSNGPKASLIMPGLNSGGTIHIILKVTDNGIPALTRYKRIILTNKR